MRFDAPDFISRESRGERHTFWDRSRRLSHGSLVALVYEEEDGIRILFATVEDRDPRKLAGGDVGYPCIGIR